MTQQHTILIVEDNPDNMTLVVDVLRSLDYNILQATDGEQGIQLATESVPDLILMDLSLPLVDGWAATRRLKSDSKMSHIPIIALTAHAMRGDRERTLEAGCDDYISKPINLKDFVKRIKEWLPPKDDSTE